MIESKINSRLEIIVKPNDFRRLKSDNSEKLRIKRLDGGYIDLPCLGAITTEEIEEVFEKCNFKVLQDISKTVYLVKKHSGQIKEKLIQVPSYTNFGKEFVEGVVRYNVPLLYPKNSVEDIVSHVHGEEILQRRFEMVVGYKTAEETVSEMLSHLWSERDITWSMEFKDEAYTGLGLAKMLEEMSEAYNAFSDAVHKVHGMAIPESKSTVAKR